MEQGWADPARLHTRGRRAGMLLDAARASLAMSLGIRPAEVFLASSGSAALAAAIAGVREGRQRVSPRVVAASVESMAVLQGAGWTPESAGDVDLIGVDTLGRVDLADLAAALESPTALACVQAANAEVGTRQPLALAHRITRAAGVPLLVDATQVIGRDPAPSDWDVLTASARDWGGPAGVAILAVRPAVRWVPQEAPDRGWVGGFPDIPGAVAAATALEHVSAMREEQATLARRLIDDLRRELPARVDGLTLAGDPDDRLPHILTFAIAGVAGETVVTELSRRDVQVASGSACTSDARMPSHVLEAMGLRADASVRVSLPLGVSEESVARLIHELPLAVAAAHAAHG
jgi:cysteine desulfurase